MRRAQEISRPLKTKPPFATALFGTLRGNYTALSERPGKVADRVG
jgi:hypothetical protein